MLVTIIGPGVCWQASLPSGCARWGSCAKLLYEAIEEIDPKVQVEAVISATGASQRRSVMAYGVVPQILPAFAGISAFSGGISTSANRRCLASSAPVASACS